MAERIREVDVLFLSTLSLRRATWMQRKQCWCMIQFLSTLSLRRATDAAQAMLVHDPISIHALLAESDLLPKAEQMHRTVFLSTLSLRRATLISTKKGQVLSLFLSTLSLRRATLDERAHNQLAPISIHALLAESDVSIELNACCRRGFLSTLSLRRATGPHQQHKRHLQNFYPRSPCGERRSTTLTFPGFGMISIHALLAESDYIRPLRFLFYEISIHALLAESDLCI